MLRDAEVHDGLAVASLGSLVKCKNGQLQKAAIPYMNRMFQERPTLR